MDLAPSLILKTVVLQSLEVVNSYIEVSGVKYWR